MKNKSNFVRLSFQIEYWIIELITRLPFSSVLRFLFIIRGVINYIFNRDWRILLDSSLSVRKQTAKVFNVPQLSWDSLSRFVSYSIEELEIMSLRRSMKSIEQLSLMEKICAKKILEETNIFGEKKGLVMLSLHYGSFSLGILALRSLGMPVYVLGSNIVKSSLLPISLQRFFEIKYNIMNNFLNGGCVLFLEEHKKQFFSELKKGAIGVALCDLLAGERNSSLSVSYFGQFGEIQAGVAHYAYKNNYPIGFFLCRRLWTGEVFFDLKINLENSNELSEIVQNLFDKLQDGKQFPQKHWLIADSFLVCNDK